MEKYIYDKNALPIPVLKNHADRVDLYYKTWELAFKNVEYIDKKGWKPQLTCMPGVNTVWQWDSCVMTFITNFSNGTISALSNLDNLYRLRRESDGYMSMAYRISTEKEAYGERVNPPLMAWAEWEHFLVTGDDSRFENVIPALAGCFSFIENNRRRSCGLYRFEDPGSSGMDNAPRGGYPAVGLAGSDVCFVDLACQQAMSAKYIGLMHNRLGNAEKAAFYAAEYERICELVNKYHWSEKAGFYFDFFARDSAQRKVKFINNKTAAAFWTLAAGVARDDRCDAVIRHMFNPNEFNTLVPFASLSRDDLNYDPTGGYWLGGVWAPTNFAAIRGLYECGRADLAREASIRYLDAVAKVESDPEFGSIWEVYAPEDYRPATREEGDLCRKDFVGWSGIAPITLLIENIIGLRFDAANNTIRFDVYEECGLKNMNFNGGKVSIECTKCGIKQGETEIRVVTQKPVTLAVSLQNADGPAAHIFKLPVGEHTLKV